ncbi:glycosyltransferase family 2 protein [Adhaeribacter swui]|uniref:Glycosyltransferase family 2 protein n=1 Tax=Adhaeribacter swui TaxID=2086471 RepID=A0A7G7G5C0_9BACT|nr:glycosyltransferase family 2 protein [Adhaeribacter swui]QNF32354.1 glycosyltransferase family 2 protein [Adhaeribacter swui]
MTPLTHTFEGVTLLITHYNRSNSLERLLRTFKEQNCSFQDIVVSDDGSKTEHLDKLKELQATYPFRLITTEKNRGLGNNINKGQDAVQTPYTLYIQEDFVPKPIFAQSFRNALDFMEEKNELDMVRFYAYFKYPFLKPYKNGFSEMLFSPWPWYWGYQKFYYYSDHPHLRRSNFLEKFGRYPEGLKGDVTEYRMMMAFIQKKGKALFYDDFQGLFDQENSSAEPSTMKRNYWRESEQPLVTAARHLYRHLRFNLDFHFSRFA